MLRLYLSHVDASMTVARLLAERYREEFGIEPTVVLNAPALPGNVPTHRVADPIRLVHHGGASRDRRIEDMIRSAALAGEHFEFDLCS